MKRGPHVYISLCLLAALLSFSCATAGLPPRPVRDLSADQLKQIIEQRRALVVVDTRTEYEYRQGHLPGAINIPPHRFDALAALLPSDKTVELVFYCRGFG
ncbi:MAG: rhodanese-like domain-containing protein [Syntrophorhabdales bacterium]|jgi:rhodanese-related sulfurtransferase